MLPYVFRADRFLCLQLFWAALAVQLSWKNVWKTFMPESGIFLVLVRSLQVCLSQMLCKSSLFCQWVLTHFFSHIKNLMWTFRFKMKSLISHGYSPSRQCFWGRGGESREEVWLRFSSSNKFLISAPTCSPVAPQPTSCLQPELVMFF